MKKNLMSRMLKSIGCWCLLIFLAGCSQTYKEDKIVQSLQEICRNEYGIDHVQVKFSGKTIGVFLPLNELFGSDLKDKLAVSALQSFQSLESLLTPSQEAVDKIEDVLFTTSRVVLSSEKEIDFYVLQATDVENTGLEMVLTGYVPDIKRVRLWDIPRSEYRKRVLNDLRLNRTVVWSKPVLKLFGSIGKQSVESVVESTFGKDATGDHVSEFLYAVLEEANFKKNLHYDFLDTRSQTSADGQALIYAKVRETYEIPSEFAKHHFLYPSGTVLEFIFVIRGTPPDKYSIFQAIPFQFSDDNGVFGKVKFPSELKLEENVNSWKPAFEVENFTLGGFLAIQLSRRIQSFLEEDERILNTFDFHKASVIYVPSNEAGEKAHFSMDFELRPKGFSPQARPISDEWKEHEDVLYLMKFVMQDFVTLARSYQFTDYEYFELINSASRTPQTLLAKNDLELFRQKKIDIVGLIRPPQPVF